MKNLELLKQKEMHAFRWTLTTFRYYAGLFLDGWVCGETPRSFWPVVRVPAEVLLQDAVWLRGIILPADRWLRQAGGWT